MAKSRGAKIFDRLQYFKSLRGTWETHWQEVADYVMPRKASINRTYYPGDRRNLHIYDSTAIHANEVLASALQSMLTNPSQFWFELSTGEKELDERDDIQRWLQDSSRIMHGVLNDTNFHSEVHEIYLDLGGFGTAAMAIEEDDDRHLRFLAQHIAGIYIDEGHDGVVDTLYRTFRWSARQIDQRWPKAKDLSLHIERAMRTNPDDEFEVLHAIYPSEDLPGKATNLKYTSSYLLTNENTILEESGFREFPYAVPRWAKASGEIYGRSPSIKGLPDIKMMNEINRVTIRGAQKTVDPPLMMPDDGFVMPVRMVPGGINYYRAGSPPSDRIQPIVTDARVDFGIQYMQDLRSRIRDHYFIDQLQLSQGPQMTATEVIQRTEENLRVLAPALSRLQVEFLRPTIKRAFAILLRRGVIPKDTIPPELSGKTLKVEYTGLIARAQKTSEGQTILRALQDAAPFIQMDPSVMDNFDADKVMRELIKIHGVPLDVIRGDTEMEEMREGRAEAQQQALQAQQQQQGLDQAGQIADIQQKLPEE